MSVMRESKMFEQRGNACGTRFFDVVTIAGRRYIKIKCRRCTKNSDNDHFHYFDSENFSELQQ